jgi:hypothetical protein
MGWGASWSQPLNQQLAAQNSDVNNEASPCAPQVWRTSRGGIYRRLLGAGKPDSVSDEIVNDDRTTIPQAPVRAGRQMSALHAAPRCAPRAHLTPHELGSLPATEAGTNVGRRGQAIRRAKKVVSAGAIVVLAAGAVAVGRWLGTHPDGYMEQLLVSPSVVERWTQKMTSRQAEQARKSKPPLVVQAEAFAAYLNPPVPPKRPVSSPVPLRPHPSPAEPKPVATAPSLRLVGISYHCSNPAESRALVWEPAGGQRWVRQGTQLGHIVIERINPGSILCRDARGIREVVMGSEPVPTMPTPEIWGHHTQFEAVISMLSPESREIVGVLGCSIRVVSIRIAGMRGRMVRYGMRVMAVFSAVPLCVLLCLNILTAATGIAPATIVEFPRSNVVIRALNIPLGLIVFASFMALWILMLHHCRTSQFKSAGRKKIWLAALFFGNVLTVPVYYLLVFELGWTLGRNGVLRPNGE